MRLAVVTDRPPPQRAGSIGLAATVVVLGAALAGAVILHGHRVDRCHPRGKEVCIEGPAPYRPGWVDPAAFGIVLAGAAAAAGILVAARSRTA
jgi:hypothetical protein